ncbi:hypothetical protein H310_05107 [Aphanomyces invadans]|uniref:GH18 domain-containing protein n=1 Tax=Aphanomyces invadans TaxID=157072 RepID=A0A024UDL3_9STRA|nr:hypothetical protein H310_05107 [Aphanomyces invadans]ETW03728.1 hypothetical protein H310_05107 [Aphanomyces invadans]|eukprot:XP_008867957.1 hypothetical protein H310_05107 [Aphanomyces invadans]
MLPPTRESKPLLHAKGRHPFAAYLQLGLTIAGCFTIFAVVFFCMNAPRSSQDATGVANMPKTSSWMAQTRRAATCPDVAPQNRVILFWQSEVTGCEQVPDGVTHVVFGFAQTFGGRVNPTFQGNIAPCVQALRQRCMYVMGAVGGANNNAGMSTIHDPDAFAASVKAFVDQYLLDGVDIDDETNYFEGLYNDQRVRAYMEALHTTLKSNGNDYLISYDAYMLETSAECWKTSRCFATGIDAYVDWINIMAYNVDTNAAHANQVYASATKTVFEAWAAKVPRDKIALGMCMGAACSYGSGPQSWVVQSWVQYNYAAHMGGMMVYAGSTDVDMGFETTHQIVQWMREATKTFGALSRGSSRPRLTAAPAATSPMFTPRRVRDSAVCGTCSNCFYPPTQGCYIGWTFDQCIASAFTWCGQ